MARVSGSCPEEVIGRPGDAGYARKNPIVDCMIRCRRIVGSCCCCFCRSCRLAWQKVQPRRLRWKSTYCRRDRPEFPAGSCRSSCAWGLRVPSRQQLHSRVGGGDSRAAPDNPNRPECGDVPVRPLSATDPTPEGDKPVAAPPRVGAAESRTPGRPPPHHPLPRRCTQSPPLLQPRSGERQ
jgi:hypothetical protein